MFRFLPLLFGAAAVLSGCSSAAVSNADSSTNSAFSNANSVIKLDPANMPPGLSTSPIPIPANGVPGIPGSGTGLPKGTTPTPGIPSAEQLKKGLKPGVTPTPGIPDQATIRKAMGMPPLNINAVPPGNTGVKVNKRNGGRPQ